MISLENLIFYSPPNNCFCWLILALNYNKCVNCDSRKNTLSWYIVWRQYYRKLEHPIYLANGYNIKLFFGDWNCLVRSLTCYSESHMSPGLAKSASITRKSSHHTSPLLLPSVEWETHQKWLGLAKPSPFGQLMAANGKH